MTAIAATQTTDAVRTNKIRNRVLWTLQIVLGLFFVIASGGPKLVIPHTLMENNVSAASIPLGLLVFIGLAEVAGGIGLMVPRLTAAAAIGLAIVTFLAAGFNAFLAHTPDMAPFPLALAAIFAWIAYERRTSLTALGALIKR
ncbi:DoxX family protein [Nocardia sp. CDC160]|uniref:DoxX family protein n=1 Tax=Nocardia sp. CDC160 TaxID=3112166 RepID=UPI002DBF46E8|nr:DoxX family protein [Nocardia sp. CDC160]MEC3920466.1 DoxX family protein [Nocardia sp. CDC160]